MHQCRDAQQQWFAGDGLVSILTELAADIGERGCRAFVIGALEDLPAQEGGTQVLRITTAHEFDISERRVALAEIEVHAGARKPHPQGLRVALQGRSVGRQRAIVSALFTQDLALAEPRFDIVRCELQAARDQRLGLFVTTFCRRHQGLTQQRLDALRREQCGALEVLRGECMLAAFKLGAAAQHRDFEIIRSGRARALDGVEQRGVFALREQRVAEQRKDRFAGRAERQRQAQFLFCAGRITILQARGTECDARRQMIGILLYDFLELADGACSVTLIHVRQADFIGGGCAFVRPRGREGGAQQCQDQPPRMT